VLYTIVPAHVIFPEQYQGVEKQQLWSMQYRGVEVVVQRGAGGQAEIVRLLSTDPNDYLDPMLQPGMTLPAF